MEVRRVELLSKTTSPFIPTCVPFVFKISPVLTPKKVGASSSQLCKISDNAPEHDAVLSHIATGGLNPVGGDQVPALL